MASPCHSRCATCGSGAGLPASTGSRRLAALPAGRCGALGVGGQGVGGLLAFCGFDVVETPKSIELSSVSLQFPAAPPGARSRLEAVLVIVELLCGLVVNGCP